MLKKAIVLLLLVSSFQLFAQNEKLYLETDTDSYIDYENKTAKLKFKEFSIEGDFIELEGKEFASEYLIIRGKDNNVWVLREGIGYRIRGIDILLGDYDIVLKEFNKGRKYKKSVVLFSSMDSFKLIPKLMKDMIDKKNKSTEDFNAQISQNRFLGNYKIKIIKHRNISYSESEVYGKLIVTEEGITIETEIPSLDLMRGNYDKEYTKVDKGMFFCNISKGYGDTFTLTFNEDKTVGGITTTNGNNNTITSFVIIE